jgi:tRNA A37 methylthiotransferase MiaB
VYDDCLEVPLPTVHLINPSHVSFGVAVITPRWLYVLAAATGDTWGDPRVVDESLETIDIETLQKGDVVGIGIHTGNAKRGYEIGRLARERGAWVVYGGIHATLFPDESHEHGAAHAVVKGDGDLVWPIAVADCFAGRPQRIYDGGRVSGDDFVSARWDLLPEGRYMWASVQTVRGCAKHCSFCSVWRTDGQKPRQRAVDRVVREVVDLRRRGFRFIALADDNFYPVTFEDLAMARRRSDPSRLNELEAQRKERFELMEELAKLPKDIVFFTQITMEAAEDPAFLDAMHNARIRGALVGVESVTDAGLKDVYKGFNLAGDALVARLKAFRTHGVHVLGSFIFGLPSDNKDSFAATVALADQADLTFAQFVLLTPFPGTVDFDKWTAEHGAQAATVDGIPVTQHWLIPQERRPKLYSPHPSLSHEEIRLGTQSAWDEFYSWRRVWARARVVKSMRNRLAFVLVSKLYRQMYANTGIATDSARVARSAKWARYMGHVARRLFIAPPMPELAMPEPGIPSPQRVNSPYLS